MNAQELIKELGFNLGLKLEFSAEHTCALKFDEVTVTFEEYENSLYLICEVGSSVRKESFFTRLLNENYLGRATANAILSHDEIKGEFILHRMLWQDLTYQQFLEILESFVQTAKKYQQLLTAESMPETAPEDEKQEFHSFVLKA